MSMDRYPTIKVELSPNDAERRTFELNYSKLTTGAAFTLSRQVEYIITALFQWRALLHKLTEKGAEDDAFAVRRDARVSTAINAATKKD